MDLLASLREGTAVEHQALEDQLDLMNPALDHERYRLLLSGFLGFVEPYERALQRWCPEPQRDLIDGRLKTATLVADLQALGFSGEQIDALPRDAEPGDMHERAGWFGRFYVMEGSTLGGRVIGPHVAKTLGLQDGVGNAYFLGHGARTGSMWKAFRERLQNSLEPAEHEAAVAAARACFSGLGHWFERALPASVASAP